MTLAELYKKHYDPKTGWPDKGSTHSYIEVYEDVLAPYRETAKNILEIGLMSGESLRMWDEYFTGDVYGIDCHLQPIGGKADLTVAIEQGYFISIGDATNPQDINKFYNGMKFDVIIEDAGHDLAQQLIIYKVMKPYIAEKGLYIIEDVQNIDKDMESFINIDPDKIVLISDLRKNKGRYDDVIILIT